MTDDAPNAPISEEDRVMATLAHALALVSAFIGPLIIWLVAKDKSPAVDVAGRESLNFQITMFIAQVVATATVFIGIGCILAPLVAVLNIVFIIVASVKVYGGEQYRYPFAIRLV